MMSQYQVHPHGPFINGHNLTIAFSTAAPLQTNYYMPANADAAVIAWRQWFKRFGANEPTAVDFDRSPPAPMAKEQVCG